MFLGKFKKAKILLLVIPILLSLVLNFPQSRFNFSIDSNAEGSKELMSNGGNRPRKYASSPVKVYVEVGETIYLGSNTGAINYSAPDGTAGNCTITNNLTNAAQENAGPLPNAGGYNPCTVTVAPGQEGVWYIDFASNSVQYWDVTVRDSGGTTIPGRAYMNRFVGNLAGFSRNLNSTFYVQTNDCYTYQVNMNGLDPYVFQFYSNNKGIRDGLGNPTYQSGNSNTGVHNPEAPDTATDITHKLFLTPPDPNMPATAPIADTEGETWLYCDPVIPSITNVEFFGIEGTQDQMGTNPLGGTISFDSNTPGLLSTVTLDLNNDGILGNGNDRTLTVTSVAGTNSIFWDGLDGLGVPVNAASGVSYNLPLNLAFNGGEVHFPIWDAEGSGGLQITRLNGPGAPDSTVYWDDTNIGIANFNDDGVASTPVGSEPNDGAGGNDPQLPSKSVAGGADSTVAGTHAWGKNGANYDGDGDTFGNRRLIDTWAFVEIPPVDQTLTFDIVETDLEIVSKTIDPDTIFEVGATTNFEIVVRNNGASDSVGAKILDSIPAEFTNLSLGSCTSTGGAVCVSDSFSGSDFEAVADIPSGDQVTYIINAEIGSLPANDMLMNTAYALRSADSTDPDATNPDSAPPVDPQAECDAAGASATCNNKKTAVLKPDPEIGIAKEISSFNVNADGTVTATYDIIVENTGNITLNDVNIDENLNNTFSGASYVVDSYSSPDFTVNPGFNGGGNTTLLDTGQSLDVGDSGLVQVTVTVTPATPAGNYDNSATAFASTPGGSGVKDASQNGNDVDPDSDPNEDPTDNNDPTPFPDFVNLNDSKKGVTDLNGGSTEPGDVLEYTIVITNQGNVTATGVDVGDIIDTDTVLDTSSVNLANCGTSFVDSSTITELNLSDVEILVGTDCEITFNVTINDPTDQGTLIENSARIRPTDQPGNGVVVDSPDLVVDGTPDLSTSTKSYTDLNGGDVEPDDEIEYTLTLINSGNALGTGIDVFDTIDPNTNTLANITLSNCGAGFTDSSTGTDLDITDLEVAVGTDCIITYSVLVNNPLPPGTILSNDVLIGGADEGGSGAFPATNTDPVSSTPDLSGASKSAVDLDGGTTQPGDRIEFTITIPNSGNSNATGVRIEDIVDSVFIVDQSSLSVVSGCGAGFDSSASSGNTIEIDDLEIDTTNPCIITFEVNIATPLDEGTLLDNVVTVFPADEGGNGSVPAAIPTLIVDATPDLSTSTKDVVDLNGGTVEPGDDLRYTINVINTGDGNATGVDLDDVIDINTENITNFSFTDCGGSFVNNSTSTLVDILSLEISTTDPCVITYDVSVKSPVDEGTVITNQVDIEPSDEGGVGGDPSSPDLTVDATPDLSSSTKDVVDLNGGTVEPGDVLQYDIRINNTGNGSASGVDVLDVIDTNTTLTTASIIITNCGTSFVDSSTTTQLDISDLEIAPSTTCRIIFSVVINTPVNEGILITNTATVSPADEGGSGSTPSSPDQTIDATPNLIVDKYHDKPTNIVTPGETITYTIEIENDGNGAGTTSFTDTISSFVGAPSNFVYTNCGGSESDSFADPTLSISNLVIQAGTICEVSYDVVADSPLNSGTVISNSADAAPASEGGNDPASESSDDISVDATPNLSTSTKTVSDLNGGTVEPGDTLEYTITMINTGDGLGTTGLTDEIDPSLTLDVASITENNCGAIFTNTSDSDTVSYTFLEVAVGTNCVIIFEAEVISPVNEGVLIGNTAVIPTTEEGGPGGSPSAPDVSVDATPDLSISKDENDADDIVTPGQVITYQVSLENNGNGQATGVDLTDTVVGNVSLVNNFTFTDCGTNYVDSSSGLNISITDLEIDPGSTCIVTYDITVATPNVEGDTINNSADAGPADEGGNDPAADSADELTTDVTPDLSTSTKVAVDTNGGTLEPGDTIDYTITIINTGDGTGTTNITDVIQAETDIDLASLSITGCGTGFTDNTDSTQVQIDDLEVEVGTNCVIEYTVTLDPILDEGTTISNEVIIDPSSEGGPGADPESSDIDVDATPQLNLSKNVSEVAPEPGETITYNIVIENTGNGTATGVDLDDTLTSTVVDSISNVIITNCGTAFADNSTPAAVGIDDLEIVVGTDCTISYDVLISNPANEGETINNLVDITPADEGGNDPDPVSADEAVVDATPDLAVTKDNQNPDNIVNPGETVTYLVEITNNGNGDATGVDLADTITSSIVDSVSNFVLTDCGTNFVNGSSGLGISIADLEIISGETCSIEYDILVSNPANEGEVINNSADVSPADEGGNDPDPVSADEAVVDATPDLAVTKDNQNPDNIVNPGETVTYLVEITNNGNGQATGVDLTDTITSSIVDSVSNFVLTDCGTNFVNGSAGLNISIADLEINPGETCSIEYDILVSNPANEGEVINNSADVSPADEGGNDPDPVSSEEVTNDATPDLSTSTKDVFDVNGGTLEPGDILEYTITIINTGNGAATTNITDAIQSDTSLDISSITVTNCGAGFTDNSDATQVQIDDLVIGVGTNCTVVYEVIVNSPLDEGTVISNNVLIDDPVEGGDGANPSATDVAVDATPQLDVTKTLSSEFPEPGETFSYNIEIENSGNGAATGVDLVDTLSSSVIDSVSNIALTNCGTSFVDSSLGLLIDLVDLEIQAGSTCEITYDVTVSNPANEGETINNSADVGPADEGGNDPDPVSADEAQVDATPDLVVDKSSSDSIVNPGDNLEYTITITNTGNGNATGVDLMDTVTSSVVDSVSNFSLTGCGSSFVNTSTGLNITISDLEINTVDDCVITYDALISNPANEGEAINNSADIGPADEGGNDPDPFSPDETNVDATPNLNVSKSPSTTTIQPGGAINYEIIINNDGDGDASGVDLIDTITSSVADSVSNISLSNCGTNFTDNSIGLGIDIENLEVVVGVDCVITYDVNISNPANEGETINNSADVGPADEGGIDPDPESGSEVSVDAVPDLSTSTKDVVDVNGGEVELGDELLYTITIINSGDGDATTNILDVIHPDTTLNLASLNIIGCGSTLVDNSSASQIQIDDLVIEVGTDCVIQFSVNINSTLTTGITISNEVVIDNPDEGGNGANPTSDDLTVNIDLGLDIQKTVYEGFNAGVDCSAATDELIIVDPLQLDRDITYCFTITNISSVYLDQISINDANLGITEVDMLIESGSTPLAPGDTLVYYYEATTNKSLDNFVEVSATGVDSNGDEISGCDCGVNNSDEASLVIVFDPPFGIKTGTFEGNDIINWNMVWINGSNNQANNVIITDEIPENLTFNGNLTCVPDGASVVISCDFESPSATFPRGRVVVVVDIAPDGPSATDEFNSENEIVISFDSILVNNEPGTIITNQAELTWDADGDGVIDFTELSDDPSVAAPDDATTVTIPELSLLRTGGEVGRRLLPIVLLASGLTILVVLLVNKQKYNNSIYYKK